MAAIRVDAHVLIPPAALEWRAVRSSGPGGQNVNKVASKVELRVDLTRITGLSDAVRARLALLAAPRLDRDGRLLVTSQRTRDQSRNLADAREKVRALVARSLATPRTRRPTAPSAAARERRLVEKHRAAARKRGRGRTRTEDE